ncbi:TetR/AcrR family transcriptional regulator [Streptomyces sp. 7-21]|jgi:AcrR family transcriptional regulator|uniref:TetR/AcrR family transcriptional regulator n=1 Tax=Streptomyces sp. 7-21 TaxID=2802283 RepID=UPI00191FBE77|nr:TetR/AcrR family transcriptional regulator [Streptomyces sp. 7-21]MBL1067912.1 TetR/AcrR family transcriptional regulator [Streptomyces sp. 7-21]
MNGENQPAQREGEPAETRRRIQAHAIRLFTERGYDATTVSDVARAAGVPVTTVYRLFPTKEDLVLHDRSDALLAARVVARPADECPVLRIGRTLVEAARCVLGPPGPSPARDLLLARLRLMIDTPALRARHLDSQFATQKAITDALLGDRQGTGDEEEYRVWVAASTCLAATHVALMRWVREDGRSDLPALIAAALGAAFSEDFGGDFGEGTG